jgi:hypothetical protein
MNSIRPSMRHSSPMVVENTIVGRMLQLLDHAANYSGHKPRTILPDPPEKVVNAIVAATVRPKPEINVGYKANAAVISHRIAPRFTENVTGSAFHKATIEDSPPTGKTAGSLYEPMENGQGVDADVRKRLADGDLKRIER